MGGAGSRDEWDRPTLMGREGERLLYVLETPHRRVLSGPFSSVCVLLIRLLTPKSRTVTLCQTT